MGQSKVKENRRQKRAMAQAEDRIVIRFDPPNSGDGAQHSGMTMANFLNLFCDNAYAPADPARVPDSCHPVTVPDSSAEVIAVADPVTAPVSAVGNSLCHGKRKGLEVVPRRN